jgi:hypothetical protein
MPTRTTASVEPRSPTSSASAQTMGGVHDVFEYTGRAPWGQVPERQERAPQRFGVPTDLNAAAINGSGLIFERGEECLVVLRADATERAPHVAEVGREVQHPGADCPNRDRWSGMLYGPGRPGRFAEAVEDDGLFGHEGGMTVDEVGDEHRDAHAFGARGPRGEHRPPIQERDHRVAKVPEVVTGGDYVESGLGGQLSLRHYLACRRGTRSNRAHD